MVASTALCASGASSAIAKSPLARGGLPRLLVRRPLRSRLSVSATNRDDDGPDGRPQSNLPPPSAQPSRARAVALESAEEEDPLPDGIDPQLLPLLGISIDTFLQDRAHQAKQTLRARCVAASLWGVLGVAGFLALGGSEGYGEDLRTLTSNGACESNNTFVWLLALGYFSVKGAVMTLAASVRAHLFESRANSAQGGHGPAAAGRMGDGASWWRWQEARWRRESAVTRAAIEFVVASTMLAALVISGGGADQLQLQIETLDERALCRLTVAMWLFWESYLAGMAGMGAGGKAAWSEAQLQRLLRVRAAQEERRQERVARLRRTGS